MIRVLGIDPGINGAICIIEGLKVNCFDMPVTPTLRTKRVCSVKLATLVDGLRPNHAFVELSSARPSQGVTSCYNYGYSNGVIHGVLGALKVPMTVVHPVVWKRVLGVPRDKGQARARATQLMPHAAHLWARTRDDGRAEAALIAYYGARQLQKTWDW